MIPPAAGGIFISITSSLLYFFILFASSLSLRLSGFGFGFHFPGDG